MQRFFSALFVGLLLVMGTSGFTSAPLTTTKVTIPAGGNFWTDAYIGSPCVAQYGHTPQYFAEYKKVIESLNSIPNANNIEPGEYLIPDCAAPATSGASAPSASDSTIAALRAALAQEVTYADSLQQRIAALEGMIDNLERQLAAATGQSTIPWWVWGVLAGILIASLILLGLWTKEKREKNQIAEKLQKQEELNRALQEHAVVIDIPAGWKQKDGNTARFVVRPKVPGRKTPHFDVPGHVAVEASTVNDELLRSRPEVAEALGLEPTTAFKSRNYGPPAPALP